MSVPAPLDGLLTEEGLSPPVVVGASNCSSTEWRLSLTGGLPGGTYEVYEAAGNPIVLVEPLGEFDVAPDGEGNTVVDVVLSIGLPNLVARQRTSTDLVSGFSAPVVRRNPASPPSPWIPDAPLWECGLATTVLGHQPGDVVRLMSVQNNTRFEIPSALGTHDYMPAGLPFEAGETVWTEYTTCEGTTGAGSVEYIVAQHPLATLPLPEIQTGSLGIGVSRFVVEGVAQGATLNLMHDRDGNTTAWTHVCGEPRCVVELPAELVGLDEQDAIRASQVLCEGSDSAVTLEEVPECGAAPAAELSPAPAVGDTAVKLSNYPRGGIARVYAGQNINPTVGLELIGYAFDTGLVPLSRAITASDLWITVAVDAPACSASSASAYVVAQ